MKQSILSSILTKKSVHYSLNKKCNTFWIYLSFEIDSVRGAVILLLFIRAIYSYFLMHSWPRYFCHHLFYYFTSYTVLFTGTITVSMSKIRLTAFSTRPRFKNVRPAKDRQKARKKRFYRSKTVSSCLVRSTKENGVSSSFFCSPYCFLVSRLIRIVVALANSGRWTSSTSTALIVGKNGLRGIRFGKVCTNRLTGSTLSGAFVPDRLTDARRGLTPRRWNLYLGFASFFLSLKQLLEQPW